MPSAKCLLPYHVGSSPTAKLDVMILVTRLNGKPMVVNAELIRSIEENPDATITLINGDHIIVKETMNEIVERAIEYGRSMRKLLPPS